MTRKLEADSHRELRDCNYLFEKCPDDKNILYMNFVEVFRPRFPVPRSLYGRALLLLMFLGFVETAIAATYRLACNVVDLAMRISEGYAFSGGAYDRFNFAARRIAFLFADFLSVLVVVGAVWLAVYACARFVRDSEFSPSDFLKISVFSLFVYFFFRFALVGFDLWIRPELREYFEWAPFVGGLCVNLACFILIVAFAFKLFSKGAPPPSKWSQGYDVGEYLCLFGKFLSFSGRNALVRGLFIALVMLALAVEFAWIIV